MIPRQADAKRGAVVVETAIVVGTILTLILFSVQIGILGFLQVTVDAASFVNARGYALGDTNPNGETTGIFPQVPAADLAVSQQPAPQPTATAVPVDYGYNAPAGSAEQAASFYNRHGGSTTIQPTLYQSTASKGGSAGLMHLFDRMVGVSGIYQEPYYEECGAHFNVSNSAQSCGAAGGSTNFAVNYFSGGENTPPYYVGFNYIEHCNVGQPWTTCNTSNNFLALGVAEKLAYPNWAIASPGVTGTVGTTTFQTAACHERAYAQLGTFFNTYKNLIALYLVDGTTINAQLTGPTTGISNFAAFHGFDVADSTTSAAIRDIYSWDVQVEYGYDTLTDPNANMEPLNPNAGCT